MRNEQGFTLLELLMVVIIIGILASIALPQYFRVTERARVGEAQQILATLRGSQIRFRGDNPANQYADTAAEANTLDMMPVPLTQSWGTANGIATAAVAGANISVVRSAGVHSTMQLIMDLDTGNVCSNDANASATWGVDLPAGC